MWPSGRGRFKGEKKKKHVGERYHDKSVENPSKKHLHGERAQVRMNLGGGERTATIRQEGRVGKEN